MATPSSSSGSSTMATPAPCRFCKCGCRVQLKTSRTQQNPGRRFLRCPKKEFQCSFFEWVDPEIPPSHGEWVTRMKTVNSKDEDEGTAAKLNFWIGECYRLQKYVEDDFKKIRLLEAEVKRLQQKDNRKMILMAVCLGVVGYLIVKSLLS